MPPMPPSQPPYLRQQDNKWWMALEHLKEDAPDRLRALLAMGEEALSDHLADKVDAANRLALQLQQQGTPRPEIDEAIAPMLGDPAEVGREVEPLTPQERARVEAFAKAKEKELDAQAS